MRRKPKEISKINKRRKLWKIFDWHWAAKRTSGGSWKTDYTSDEDECKGYGFFRKNHSVSCTDHSQCRAELARKRAEKRRFRRENKKVIEAALEEIEQEL